PPAISPPPRTRAASTSRCLAAPPRRCCAGPTRSGTSAPTVGSKCRPSTASATRTPTRCPRRHASATADKTAPPTDLMHGLGRPGYKADAINAAANGNVMLSHQDHRITALMRSLCEQTQAIAPDIRLLFVTNLRPENEEIDDLGPDGVSNIAQYYSRREA